MKGPVLPANISRSFTAAAATAFAGKPAPTSIEGVERDGGIDTYRCRSGLAREEAGPAGQYLPVIHRRSRHRIRGRSPLLHRSVVLNGKVVSTRTVVGAGLPAKGPVLPAHISRSFTVAAATAFAGEARSYIDRCCLVPTRTVVGAGLPAKGPGLPANIPRSFTVAVATAFAGKARSYIGRWC